ncbi:hypothetical protein [Nannocystis sp. SCPEA4]|uniref:hypothetical protein n=1 Tax=Nannocystis sp. SCPEA4 TaxID=2996787 RepID=UPI002270DAA7|nr:hypothetical protein [Nannocystis sp. SCPEA4]MCY1057383.1 hypothetical protein [Nannocystis sp. SCPEA4]
MTHDSTRWALGVGIAALLGCDPDDGDCIAGERLWQSPPPGPLCIRGHLVVEGRHPDELAVLARVEAIEGSLIIHDNPELAELPAWSALTSIGGSLSISNNPALTVVHGFPVLEGLSGALYVAENPALVRLDLRSSVTTVDSLFITLNPSLTELRSPSALKTIAGDARVTHNAALLALELPGLADVGGDFLVTDNANLGTAELPSLRAVDTLSIAANPKLESLAGFSALKDVRGALIEDNDALTAVRWTAPGTSRLMITGNAQLEQIDGVVEALADDGHLRIELNSALRAVTGFAGTTSLASVTFAENTALPEVSALEELTHVGELSIVRNAALVGPDEWFPTLAEISGDLSIFGNVSLSPTLVDALTARLAVGGTIRVGDNFGQDTALDPCPWPEDGICDATEGWLGRGTELCVIDLKDCGTP